MFSRRVKRHLLRNLLSPLPAEEGDWYCADGRCLCPICREEYSLHPDDPDAQWLVVLCNGDRVKL